MLLESGIVKDVVQAGVEGGDSVEGEGRVVKGIWLES